MVENGAPEHFSKPCALLSVDGFCLCGEKIRKCFGAAAGAFYLLRLGHLRANIQFLKPAIFIRRLFLHGASSGLSATFVIALLFVTVIPHKIIIIIKSEDLG